MQTVQTFFVALVGLFSLTGCGFNASSSEEENFSPASTFEERYSAAQAREQHLLSSMGTADMVRGTQNIAEEFFPEAAAMTGKFNQGRTLIFVKKRLPPSGEDSINAS